MKFGKRMLSEAFPEWRNLYLDYKSLKGVSLVAPIRPHCLETHICRKFNFRYDQA